MYFCLALAEMKRVCSRAQLMPIFPEMLKHLKGNHSWTEMELSFTYQTFL